MIVSAVATFLAVLPVLVERASEAEAIIPMAISIGIGVLFSTLISLALVPALYLINEDLGRRVNAFLKRRESAL